MPFKRKVAKGFGDFLGALSGGGSLRNELAGALAGANVEKAIQAGNLSGAKGQRVIDDNSRFEEALAGLETRAGGGDGDARALLEFLKIGGGSLTQARSGFNIANDRNLSRAKVRSESALKGTRDATTEKTDLMRILAGDEALNKQGSMDKLNQLMLELGGTLGPGGEVGKASVADLINATDGNLGQLVKLLESPSKQELTAAKVGTEESKVDVNKSRVLNIEGDTANAADITKSRLDKFDVEIDSINTEIKNKKARGELISEDILRRKQQLTNDKAREKLIIQQTKKALALTRKAMTEKTRNVLSQNEHLKGILKVRDRFAEDNPKVGGTITKQDKNGDDFTRDRRFLDGDAKEQSDFSVDHFNNVILPEILKPLPVVPADPVTEDPLSTSLLGAPKTLDDINTADLTPADGQFLQFLESEGISTREEIESITDIRPENKEILLQRFDDLIFRTTR